MKGFTVKMLAGIIALLFTFALCPAVGMTAGETTPDGFVYEIRDDSTGIYAEITGYTGTGGAVEIPMYVGTDPIYVVTTVGQNAFTGNTSITSMAIPGMITSIHPSALRECANLKAVTVGTSGLSSAIGGGWFEECAKVETVTLSNSVTEIGKYAFSGCAALASITLPDSITSIGEGAFQNCTGLTAITIPGSVTSMAPPFAGCSNIRSVVIGNGITAIGDYLFLDITSLETVDLPSTLTSIGRGTFSGCTALASIDLPDGITSIGASAFYGCTGLTAVTIPGSVTHMYLPFAACSNIRSVVIGSGITAIGPTWFEGMTGLETVNIPSTVTSIGEDAFSACYALTSIDLPVGITSIGEYAFRNCTGLTEATIYCPKPAGLSDTLFNSAAPGFTMYLHVKHAASWNGFGTYNKQIFCLGTLYSMDEGDPGTEKYYLDSNAHLIDPPYNTPGTAGMRAGYTFQGWHKDFECANDWDFTTAVMTDDFEAYAGWSANQYTLTFNAAGGTVSPSSKTVTYGQAYGALPAPGKAGYTFTGWFTGENGGGAQITESTIVQITADATLHASWQANAYTVTFNAAGGTVSPGSKAVTYGQAYGALPAPEKAGHAFTGWYTGENGSGARITESSTVQITADATLYASWQANACTVTFNAAGGTVSPGSKIVTYGQAYGALPTPSRPKFSFAGWFTEENGGGTQITESSTVQITADTTLYADWQRISPDLAGIRLSAGTLSPGFSASRTKYTVNIGENTDRVVITPVKEYDGAAITVDRRAVSNKIISVANGKTATCKIAVKYGKATKIYTLTIKRAKSTNNTLASLSASAGTFDKPFDPGVTGYRLTLPEGVSKVTLKAARAVSLEKLSPASKKLTLINGQTSKVTFKVKAQSGAVRTYTVTVTRSPSSDTGLKFLRTNSKQYPLVPAFNNGTNQYNVTLPAGTGSVTINAAARGYKAAVYIDGVKRASKKITLSPGAGVSVVVTVKAQSGATATYTVNIKR